MKATNIKWDFIWDKEEEDALGLPEEMEIPEEIENDEYAISNYLTNVTGFCYYGYVLEK